MDRGRVMSKNQERADAVVALLIERKNEGVTSDFVQVELGCGRRQALRAMQKARFQLADEGKRVSYAVATNGYTVALEGNGTERTQSYVTRSQAIISQRRNAGRIMAPSVDHGRSSKAERAIANWAMADQMAAEADQIKLDTLKELLS